MRNFSSATYLNLFTVLIAGLIFILPSNLFYKLWEQTAYSQGLLIDYLIPKIYLSDILILAVFGVFCAKNCQDLKQKFTIRKIRTWLVPLALFSLLLIRQLFTPHPIIAYWTVGKLTLFIVLAWIITHVQALFEQKHWVVIKYSLVLTIVFQALLAIFQSHYQQPLFGYLFLGEPNIAQPVGIAYSVNNLGQQRVLPYGTTAHPNVLAGIAVIYFWMYWQIKKKTSQVKYELILSSLLTCAVLMILALTHSLTAWFGLAWVLLLHFRKITDKDFLFAIIFSILIIPVFIFIFDQLSPSIDSFSRRNWLIAEAATMFSRNPVFGVGMTQFTTQLSPIGQSLNGPAFIQPAHHIFWLWLAETGILGVTLIIYLFRKLSSTNQQHIKYIFTLLVGFISLDHYLLTHQAGLLLLVLIFSLARAQIQLKK